MNRVTDPQSPQDDSASFARSALRSISTGARTAVVNRTHRVIRERAVVMQARRSRVRSLMLPLIICSSLLILTCLAIWSGLYEYQEAAQSDVSTLASIEANNHFLLVTLWFVPVTAALLATVWYRRSRILAEDEAR